MDCEIFMQFMRIVRAMIKTLRVRLYPNEEQQILLEKHFGACRLVSNHFLEASTKQYTESSSDRKKVLSAFDTMKMLMV
ncbi:MAG TPA: helix-turn-helix domain-containing protein [Thermoplasmataceae archaeon]|nr:helix-turn-helix domain-containing protein [Thermoplasmataceae archaeon]